MEVNFKDSVGKFLFQGWDAGRKSHFGYYFATLVFVATLCFIVEAIPYIRSIYFSHNSKKKVEGYNEIQNKSNMQF